MGNIANHAYDDRVGAAIEDSVNAETILRDPAVVEAYLG